MCNIPKIIHQLWIGDKPPPSSMMATWKTKHPDYEYILWNEAEFTRRHFVSECQPQIDLIKEINGKADIYRWEILYKYGGIFVDADSVCIEYLEPSVFLNRTGFASFENEVERGNLIATVALGFVPQHPLCGDIIQWIKTSPDAITMIQDFKAWYSVGPGAITRFLETGNYPDFTVFPSHFFLPKHFTGAKYNGHKRVYAHQEWGSTHDNYDTIDTIPLPADLSAPANDQNDQNDRWISILIPSYNTPRKYVRECLDSIRSQIGSHLGLEVVWMNDGSDEIFTKILVEELAKFLRLSRFCKVAYYTTSINMGIAECLRRGVELCSHEIIARMDSDDVMVDHRIITQYKFMMDHPEVPMCGTGIRTFSENGATRKIWSAGRSPATTNCKGDSVTGSVWLKDIVFPTITIDQYKKTPVSWMMSHPSLMMRKSAILELGNYRDVYKEFQIIDPEDKRSILDDFDLEFRCLQKYGVLHNLPSILMYYRIHKNQITFDGILEKSSANQEAMRKIIASVT